MTVLIKTEIGVFEDFLDILKPLLIKLNVTTSLLILMDTLNL